MIIGVPKEIKAEETRVAIIPNEVSALLKHGHRVMIEKGAGLDSGITDEDYKGVGAEVLSDKEKLFDLAEMILKVKEPLAEEYDLFKGEHILFTFLHLAANETLTRTLALKKIIAIGYETVQRYDGGLPLLRPMSEIAGRLSIQEGAHYLQKHHGGRGILLSGVPGVPPANVVIIGGGTVGTNALMIALGLGAQVYVLDTNMERLRYLDMIVKGRIITMKSAEENLVQLLDKADLLIGAVLIPGGKPPDLVTYEMLKLMKKGSVAVDVSIDQGGCFQSSKPTYHNDPIYEVEGVIHYCVCNMPAAVPITSTWALTNETIPYVMEIADRGITDALRKNKELARGVNLFKGKITHPLVAQTHNMEYQPLDELIF